MDRFDEMRVKNISGGGGTVIIPPEAGTLTGIIISSMPKKLDYMEGEEFDTTGLEVTATYDNNVYGIVTSNCEIIVNSPLTTQDKYVKIKYQGFETKFDINVYGKIHEIPTGTTNLYHFNNNYINEITGVDDLNHSDCSISKGKFNTGITGRYLSFKNAITPTLAEIKNGATFTVEAWVKFSGVNASRNFFTFGNTSYIYLKMNKNTFYLIQTGNTIVSSSSYTLTEWNHFALVFKNSIMTLFVNGKNIASASVTSSNDKGLMYIIQDNDIYMDEIVVSTEALYTADFEPPTSYYGGERILNRLYMDTKPSKTIYKAGEYFDLTGAKIMAVFTTGEIIDVTSECVIENDTPITTSDSFRKISYTYESVTKYLYINVGAYTIESSVDLSSAKLLMNFDGNTADLTGLNTPTIVGNNLYGEGKFGMARYFNGSSDYISMPIENINFSTGDFTIVFWAKTIVKNSLGIMIGNYKYYTDGGYIGGIRIGIDADNTLFCTLNKNANDGGENIYVISAHTHKLNNNIWTHFALVRKGNSITFYVNGSTLGTVEYTGYLYVYDLFTIGARDVGASSVNITNYFNGYIDDLIITKSALWDSEFTPPSMPFSSIN